MEISIEIKEKIISQYWGQNVLRIEHNDDKLKVTDWFQFKNAYLVLKPLSSITDEDSIEAYKLFGYKAETGSDSAKMMFEYYGTPPFDNSERLSFKTATKIFQYLQSKGYALPYMEYTVDDLVNAGIYQLEK